MKKKILALAALMALAALLCGCSPIVVEDSQPVRIGCAGIFT